MHRTAAIIALAVLVSGDPIRLPQSQLLSTSPFSPQGRIVGGKPTSIEEHPWQVSLQAYGFHFCGGSILSEKVILTAGHCASYSPDLTTVRVGSSIFENGGSVHQVEKVVRNEDFIKNSKGIPENDVAVMFLKTSIEFSESARPIPLFELGEDAEDGVMATISGWGSTIENGDNPEILRTVNVPIVSKLKCNEAYDSWGGIPDGQICAAYPEGGKDTCQGDSGGPLVINGRQAGIVSWGNGCARKGFPGVYTEIATVRDWIDKNTNLW